MAEKVVMPKQGNSVESCVIDEWKKKEGDQVKLGDILCEVETDKSTIEVESTAEGILLKILRPEGDDVPVMLPIAIVGSSGEDIAPLLAEIGEGGAALAASAKEPAPGAAEKEDGKTGAVIQAATADVAASATAAGAFASQAALSPAVLKASPRARGLAAKNGLDLGLVAPTGPKGRIIERDVEAACAGRQPLTPAALAALGPTVAAPALGGGIGGRVLVRDLRKKVASSGATMAQDLGFPGKTTEIPVKGIRKVTAQRMLESVLTTAQLTLNAYADATALMGLRAKFKASDPQMGVQMITLNDLVMFAAAYTLKKFPEFNAHYLGSKIVQFESVHLGMAVDTPKGLVVANIRNADSLSLRGLSAEAKRLVEICRAGKAQPDDISGSTFSVTNVGAFGVDSFTPIINIPEVAILGVASVAPRPVRKDGRIEFVDMIGLSLTVNHQAVDGAPGARFLKALCLNIKDIDMLLAVEG